MDEPVPYSVLTAAGEAAGDMFVVDTSDVDLLRRRCPSLFARRPSLAVGRGRSAS